MKQVFALVSVMLLLCMGTTLTMHSAHAGALEKVAKAKGQERNDHAKNVALIAPLDDYLPAALWIRIGVHHPVTGEIIDYEWKLNTCAGGERALREECYRQMMRSVYTEGSPRHPGLDLAAYGATMPINFTGSRLRQVASNVSSEALGVSPLPADPPHCTDCGGGGSCETVLCSPDVCGPNGCGSTCVNCLH